MLKNPYFQKSAAAAWIGKNIGKIKHNMLDLGSSDKVNALGSSRIRKTIDSFDNANLYSEQEHVEWLKKHSPNKKAPSFPMGTHEKSLTHSQDEIGKLRNNRKGGWQPESNKTLAYSGETNRVPWNKSQMKLGPQYTPSIPTHNNNVFQLNNGASVSLGKTPVSEAAKKKYQSFREEAASRDQARYMGAGTLAKKPTYTPVSNFSF